jgi:3-hydroxybutyryl-CoA dehydratase
VITTYLDDIAVGDTSVSRQRTITETDIVQFAMFTGDWHPIHTVVPYAEADARFGERIAHGALVISVGLGLVEFWPRAMLAFYGFDRLRFVHPTHIGDTLRVETEVLAIRERPDRTGVVTYRFVVLNDKDEPLLVADFLALVAARPEEGSDG